MVDASTTLENSLAVPRKLNIYLYMIYSTVFTPFQWYLLNIIIDPILVNIYFIKYNLGTIQHSVNRHVNTRFKKIKIKAYNKLNA